MTRSLRGNIPNISAYFESDAHDFDPWERRLTTKSNISIERYEKGQLNHLGRPYRCSSLIAWVPIDVDGRIENQVRQLLRNAPLRSLILNRPINVSCWLQVELQESFMTGIFLEVAILSELVDLRMDFGIGLIPNS